MASTLKINNTLISTKLLVLWVEPPWPHIVSLVVIANDYVETANGVLLRGDPLLYDNKV